jgi:tRNA(adenine34) deaminase
MLFSDDFFMKEALKEARKAFDLDEVPVGSVIVCNDLIIARGYNLSERLQDATAHAEMQALTSASNHLGTKFLEDCTLYVTIEPCIMCAGAMFWSRVGKLVYGAPDEKRGYSNVNALLLHPKTDVISGVLEEQCSKMMTDYFKHKRYF